MFYNIIIIIFCKSSTILSHIAPDKIERIGFTGQAYPLIFRFKYKVGSKRIC